jgi:hypothetical protein
MTTEFDGYAQNPPDGQISKNLSSPWRKNISLPP